MASINHFRIAEHNIRIVFEDSEINSLALIDPSSLLRSIRLMKTCCFS